MSDAVLSLGIDPTGVQAGRDAAVRSLSDIKAAAQQLALQMGLTGDQASNAAKRVTDALNQTAKQTGLTYIEFEVLGHIARATFDAMAAGINPVRVLFFESSRLAQVLPGMAR